MSLLPSGVGRVYIVDENGVRHPIRIHTRAGFTPSESPVETRRSLDRIEGERRSVGSPGHGSFSFDWEPNELLSSNRRLSIFHRNGGLCTIEMDMGAVPAVLDKGADMSKEIVSLTAEGVLTMMQDLGTEERPVAPFTQGAGIVVGDELLIVDEILTKKTARVSRWGTTDPDPRITENPSQIAANSRISQEDASLMDPTAISTATHLYQLVQCGIRSQHQGRVSQAGGLEASGAGETSASGTIQLSSARTLFALLPPAA